MSIIMSKMSSRSQKSYAEAFDIVEQTIGSIRTVVSFTGEKKAIDSYDTKLQTAYKATVQQGLAAGFGVGSTLFITFSSYALALWYGSKLVASGNYNGGTVINVIFAVMTGGLALGQASPCLNAFSAGRAAAYKLFQTISRRPDIDVYDTEGLILEDINGDIELKDVYFRYPARPDIQIFKGFSLQIPKGSTTALVGESGSEKSTIISLVERFYDPKKGEVLIDDVNIKTFQLKWLRQKIGLVSQEPALFATTIRENILYGKEDATLEEIKFAAEIANATMFINKMPQGFDTMVGKHGTQLSGGQKQRIAIARAILKNLLLDEATSALDAESEKVVQKALDRIMVNRTTVIVAHRLTTVRSANAIVVVQCGTIVEKGTHAQLIANPLGTYTQLVRLQGAYSDETNVNNSDHVNNQCNESVISRNLSQRASFRRTSSKGSSIASSRRSYSFSFVPPASVGVHETEELEEGKSKKQSNRSSKKDILRLASLNKPELPVFILGCIAAAINGSIFPIFGLLLSSVITTLFEPPHQLCKDANFWSLMYVILAIACLLIVPIQMTSFAVISGRLVKRIRALTFSRIIYQEIGWFDDSENSSGAIGARLSTDAATVRSVVGDALSLIFQNIATIIAGLMIAFIANWKLANCLEARNNA